MFLLKRQIRELKREADRGKEAISELEKVRAVLGQMGLRTGYGWIDELEQALKQGRQREGATAGEGDGVKCVTRNWKAIFAWVGQMI
jgi:hypothetical protein